MKTLEKMKKNVEKRKEGHNLLGFQFFILFFLFIFFLTAGQGGSPRFLNTLTRLASHGYTNFGPVTEQKKKKKKKRKEIQGSARRGRVGGAGWCESCRLHTLI
jgi:hypothetical protein